MAEHFRHAHDWNSFKRLFKIVVVAGISIFLVASLYKPVLLAVVASLIISYISSPVIDSLCARSPLGRRKTIALVISIIVLLLAVAAVFVLPFIYEETLHIIRLVPDAVLFLEQTLAPVAIWLKQSKLVPDEAIEAGMRRLSTLPHVLADVTTFQKIFVQTPVLLEIIFNIAMIPPFTYLILAELDRLKFFVKTLVPEDIRPLALTFIVRINAVLRSVVKGQFTIAFLLSVFYMIGFVAIDVPSGLAIGALAGICRIVPFLDVVVGLLLCSVVIITQGSGLATFIGTLAVIAVVQTIDGMIITPRIIGDRAGLHPIVVIASVYAFGGQFGALGVLLAVPVIAAISVACRIGWPYVRQAPYFR